MIGMKYDLEEVFQASVMSSMPTVLVEGFDPCRQIRTHKLGRF